MSVPTSASSLKDNHKEGSASLESSAKDSQQGAQPKTNIDLSKLDISTLSSEELEFLQDITDKRGRSRFPDLGDRHQCIRKPNKKTRPSSDLTSSSSGLFTPPSSTAKPQTQPTSETQETSALEEGEIVIPQLYPSAQSQATRSLRPEDKEYLLRYGCIRAAPSRK